MGDEPLELRLGNPQAFKEEGSRRYVVAHEMVMVASEDGIVRGDPVLMFYGGRLCNGDASAYEHNHIVEENSLDHKRILGGGIVTCANGTVTVEEFSGQFGPLPVDAMREVAKSLKYGLNGRYNIHTMAVHARVFPKLHEERPDIIKRWADVGYEFDRSEDAPMKRAV